MVAQDPDLGFSKVRWANTGLPYNPDVPDRGCNKQVRRISRANEHAPSIADDAKGPSETALALAAQPLKFMPTGKNSAGIRWTCQLASYALKHDGKKSTSLNIGQFVFVKSRHSSYSPFIQI